MPHPSHEAHPDQLDLARVFSSVRLLGPPFDDKLIRLVAHLFEPQEAALALHLPYYRTKPTAWIAKRAKRPASEIEPLLEAMGRKRIIYRGEQGYTLLPLIPGMFEHMLIGGIDTPWHRRYAELLDDVFRAGYVRQYARRPVRAVRNIPVQQVVEHHSHVVSADLASEMIRAHHDLAVANVCQCRQSLRFIGKSCKRSSPEDGCLIFGTFAAASIRSGDARRVTRDEMRAIVEDRWRKNLVFLTGNVDPESDNAICTCCECCCHLLESVNEYGAMPVIATPHFVARVDEVSCTSCMKCAKACNTRAHELVSKKHVFHEDRCVGCGLCVSACKEEVVKLVPNPRYRAPATGFGKLGLQLLPGTAITGLRVKLERGWS